MQVRPLQYWLQYELMGVAELKVNLIQIVKVALKWKLFFNSMRKLMEIISIYLIKTDWKVFIPRVTAPGHDWYLLSELWTLHQISTSSLKLLRRYCRVLTDDCPPLHGNQSWATLSLKTLNFPTCPNSVKSLNKTWRQNFFPWLSVEFHLLLGFIITHPLQQVKSRKMSSPGTMTLDSVKSRNMTSKSPHFPHLSWSLHFVVL